VYWETGRRSGGDNRQIDLTKSEEELLELIRCAEFRSAPFACAPPS
jgi:hypothetical protein